MEVVFVEWMASAIAWASTLFLMWIDGSDYQKMNWHFSIEQQAMYKAILYINTKFYSIYVPYILYILYSKIPVSLYLVQNAENDYSEMTIIYASISYLIFQKQCSNEQMISVLYQFIDYKIFFTLSNAINFVHYREYAICNVPVQCIYFDIK